MSDLIPLSDERQTFFGRSPFLLWSVLAAMFLLALGIRMVDLTDAPLDYQPMRQLRGAIIARAIYYRILPEADPAMRAKAAGIAAIMEPLEPPILENIVARLYLVTGGERPWVVRIVNALFWLVGGVAIFLFARRISTVDGAVVALAYYLFLPFGITVSRSFQPEAMTIMFMAWSMYAVYRWAETPSWGWAAAGAIASGMTILTKGRLAPIVLCLVVAAALAGRGFRRSLTDMRAWAIGLITVAIPAAYYLLVIRSSTITYIVNTSDTFRQLIFQPSFYVRWVIFLDGLAYFGVILVGLLGVALAPRLARWVLLALLVGFGLYGLSLPYTMFTHDYYNLPIVPVVAVSLAPIGSLLLSYLRRQSGLWQAFAMTAGLLAIAFPLWLTRSALLSKDYRSEHLGWEKIAAALPATGRMIALTQDYGYRLAYYGWKTVSTWPGQADYASFQLQGHNEGKDIQAEFKQRTDNVDYFLVTLFNELDAQPGLKALLYDHYTVIAQSPTFVLFDLHKPK